MESIFPLSKIQKLPSAFSTTHFVRVACLKLTFILCHLYRNFQKKFSLSRGIFEFRKSKGSCILYGIAIHGTGKFALPLPKSKNPKGMVLCFMRLSEAWNWVYYWGELRRVQIKHCARYLSHSFVIDFYATMLHYWLHAPGVSLIHFLPS